MEIYNTLTKKKELFEPRKGKKIQMFVCGPTVYDYIHIGNARTFVFFDVVAKYLRYKGYDVNYIQNITDIDNKIIERAQKEGVDPLEYAKRYTEIFKQDMKELGVTSPEYKNATDHIPEVIKQVQALLNKGNAYVIENDGIYFDLSTFPDYGKLSGRTAGMADDAVSRIDDSDKKRNRGDFALWKFSAPGDPSWFAPFGDGRPGWHIEDTAITDKYFGPQYDIHGGGQDLIFPHHEAEIAQQESASGLKPFVKYWLHGGFLINKSEKMSKSLGNFTTFHEALKSWPSEVLRFFFLSNHYRSPLDFSDSSLEQASAAVKRVRNLLENISIAHQEDKTSKTVAKESKKIISALEKSMDDDFNTPKAFGALFEFITAINSYMKKRALTSGDDLEIRKVFNVFRDIFGVIPEISDVIPPGIQSIVDKRETARKEKNWQKSDELRQELKNLGYEVEDTAHGPLILKK